MVFVIIMGAGTVDHGNSQIAGKDILGWNAFDDFVEFIDVVGRIATVNLSSTDRPYRII